MTPTRLAIAWTAAIVVACLIPGSSLPGFTYLPFSTDKWVHVAMFVGFGGLWAMARPGERARVFGAGVAFGIAIELAQWGLPIGRSADPFDALADVVGLGIGLGLARWLMPR